MLAQSLDLQGSLILNAPISNPTDHLIWIAIRTWVTSQELFISVFGLFVCLVMLHLK